MQKEVRYNGLSTVPPDNISNDGDNALLLNLVPEDGALKPVLPPKVMSEGTNGTNILYIHKTATYTHYIMLDTTGKKLTWTADKKTPSDLFALDGKKLYQVTALGNTLMVLTDDGVYYFLWKGDKDGYLSLGNHIPELPISFGLQGEMLQTDEFTVNAEEYINAKQVARSDGQGTFTSFEPFSEKNKKKVSEQVLGKVNKFIADNSTNKGKFLYPFFVRYAYRLYDGTLTMHSAPILMVCSSSCAPIVLWGSLRLNANNMEIPGCRVIGMFHKLDYSVLYESSLNLLKNWSDIVKSVDIFISKPIYTYDQNGQCDKLYNYDEYGDDIWGYSVCKHVNQTADTNIFPLRYQLNHYGYAYQMTYHNDKPREIPGGVLGLPRKTTATIKEDIRNTSLFYLLKSIKIDQLATTRTIIDVPEDYLQSLLNREVMTDDYDSHDTLVPQYSFSYNSRINLSGVKKKLFDGYAVGEMFSFTDGYVYPYSDNVSLQSTTLNDFKNYINVLVIIKQDGKDIAVRSTGYYYGYKTPFLFIYYPNVNAYKAYIWDDRYFNAGYYEVPLEPHGFLNGAFFFDGWDGAMQKKYMVTNQPPYTTDTTINIPNKVYTSEVNNPFYFPLKGINTVGTGNIMALSSAVKALSEGQFGQFPLYAFSSDGVWALEVSSTGTYTARQPVTRDVCINPASITQIDTAVLFATDRGIMLLEGSQSMCISDVLNGDNAVPVTRLPKIDKVLSHAELKGETLNVIPFLDFIKDCRMIYDYKHQRIIVYNPDTQLQCNYAYVWSLKSKQWGMMQSDISDSVNSYPDALAVLENGSLVNFSEDGEGIYKNILITRPLKFDAYDIHKTVDNVIQRGVFRPGHIKSVLYASNDLFNWVPVWTSADHYLRGFSGTPYKYFRVALLCELAQDECITSCSVNLYPRLTNQQR